MTKTRITGAIALFCLLPLGTSVAEEAPVSGLDIGAPTASIPVLDITGKYQGSRICYVCEFQDDPNVLGFFRDTSDETAELIVQLNDLYLSHKGTDFKAVAMIVAGESAADWLTELNESANIEIPLTVFKKGPQDLAVRLFELNLDVDNTFLVTVNRSVVTNVADIGASDFERVVDATTQMMAQQD